MDEKYQLVEGDGGEPAIEITRTVRVNLRQARNQVILLQRRIVAAEKRLEAMRLQLAALGETVERANP